MKFFQPQRVAVFLLLVSPTVPLLIADTPTSTQTPQGINLNSQTCGIDLSLPDYLVRNNDDDQDKTSQYYENWDLDHIPSPGDNDLKAVTITGTAGATDGTMTLEIIKGSDKINGIFWKDGEKNQEHYPLSWTVPANTSRMETLYIEGYMHSDSVDDIEIKATISCPAGLGADGKNYAAAGPVEVTKQTTVYEADLDTDSNNNEGITFTSGSKEEDVIEASDKADGNWTKRPGKILMVNDGFGDDIPDWADGFDSDSNTEQDSVCGPPITFIPMLLERKKPFTDKCKVKFTYSASNPASVSTVGGNGFPDYNFLFTKPSGKLIRIWKKNNDGSMRDKTSVVSGGDYVPDGGVEIPWDKLSDGTVAHLWIEAVEPSAGLADINVVAEITEDGATASDEVNFTAIKITCEPIDKRPDSGLYPINPSGVVAGAPGQFKIELLPSDYPDAEIKWTPVAGGGTVTPATGRAVSFENAANTSQLIYPQILGNYYDPPRFHIETYTDYHTVDIHAYVVSTLPSGSSTRIPADAGISLASVVSQLNESHRQLGVRYTLASVNYLPSSFDSYYDCDVTEGNTLVNHNSTSGGIEMYVVDDSPVFAGANYPDKGLIVTTGGYSSRDVALIAAHEIGHEGGLEDVYVTNSYSVSTLSFGSYQALGIWNVHDWPADSDFASDPSFYKRDDSAAWLDPRRQSELIKSQVMHGVAVGYNLDFSFGRVRGVGGGYSSDPLSIRDAEVGILDFDRAQLIHH